MFLNKEKRLPQSREPITVTATIEPASSAVDTKTTLNTSDWTAYWNAGDDIGISAIPASGENVVNKRFYNTGGSGKKEAIFVPSGAAEWPSGEALYLAVYPHNDAATISGSPKVINLTYNHYQSQCWGEYADFGSGVMVARATSIGVPSSLSFINIFSIIKMSLTGTDLLSSVTFRDLSGKPVSGAYTIAVADGTVPVFPDTPADDDDKLIELLLSIELSDTPQDIYLAVPPRTYTDGFEYVFNCLSGSRMTKTMTASQTLEAGKYYTYNSSLAFTQDIVDLSSKGTANCYIVPESGKYSFDATVIGNGTAGLLGLPKNTTNFHTETTTIAPVSAAILWQDYFDDMESIGLISNVTLSGGKVIFNATGACGNAVVAVYDGPNGTGNILWSWHIWCTEQPGNQEYKNAADKTFTLLDRNLGAVANSMWSGRDSKGLLYQWGRKDPFPYECMLYGPVTSITNIATSAVNGTIANTIKNPSTFYTSDIGTSDWHYKTDGTQEVNNYLWGNPYGYNYASANPSKSIYDPCPPGYMVAPIDTWTNFDKGGNLPNIDSYWNEGYNFFLQGTSGNATWYPAVGFLQHNDGSHSDPGGYNGYWTSSPYSASDNAADCLHFSEQVVIPLSYGYRASGFAVRCCTISR